MMVAAATGRDQMWCGCAARNGLNRARRCGLPGQSLPLALTVYTVEIHTELRVHTHTHTANEQTHRHTQLLRDCATAKCYLLLITLSSVTPRQQRRDGGATAIPVLSLCGRHQKKICCIVICVSVYPVHCYSVDGSRDR